MKTIQDLDKYLVEECEYTPTRVADMTPYKKLDAWLKYQGIVGYTYDILRVISIAYNKNFNNE